MRWNLRVNAFSNSIRFGDGWGINVKHLNVIVTLSVGILLGWLFHYYYAQSKSGENSKVSRMLPEVIDLRAYQSEAASVKPEINVPARVDIESLLREGSYERAIALYIQQRGAVSGQEAETNRQLILQHVLRLHRSNLTMQALGLLNSFLESEFNDVEAMELKARLLADLKRYDEQIEALYDARSYAYQADVITNIESEIHGSVDSYRQLLLQWKDYPGLLTLYQRLIYLEPEYPLYFIELAKAQQLNHLTGDARQSLELVMYDPEVGGEAQRMLAELAAGDDDGGHRVAQVDDYLDVPLLPRGNHFVVEAILNGSERLKLIIDTGASLTVIKSDRLVSALDSDLSRYPQHMFSTANGAIKAPVIKVASLSIGGFEVTNIDVGGLTLANTSGVDGLLGMNFLKHFRFFIDQQNNQLRLALNSQ